MNTLQLQSGVLGTPRSWIASPGEALADALQALGAPAIWQRRASPVGDIQNEATPEVDAPLLEASTSKGTSHD
jgi:hypothetical protein